MSNVDTMLKEAATAIRASGVETLTTDHENGILRAGQVTIRITSDDNYMLETEVCHDLVAGETVADAQANIEERLAGLTDSSVEIGDPIIDESVGQVRVTLERECKCIEDLVRWSHYWLEAT